MKSKLFKCLVGVCTIFLIFCVYMFWVNRKLPVLLGGHTREESIERILRVAVKVFYRDCGRYPTSFSEMSSSNPVCPGWKQPTLGTDDLKDTWGRRYIYILDNIGAPIVISSGSDKEFGTVDDISFGLLLDQNLRHPL